MNVKTFSTVNISCYIAKILYYTETSSGKILNSLPYSPLLGWEECYTSGRMNFPMFRKNECLT